MAVAVWALPNAPPAEVSDGQEEHDPEADISGTFRRVYALDIDMRLAWLGMAMAVIGGSVQLLCRI